MVVIGMRTAKATRLGSRHEGALDNTFIEGPSWSQELHTWQASAKFFNQLDFQQCLHKMKMLYFMIILVEKNITEKKITK